MMQVEDRLAVFELISRYSYTYDENLLDEFLALSPMMLKF
jgi:hypothetical protein